MNDNIEMADIAEKTLMNELVFISHEVLAEVVYVLIGVYSVPKVEVSDMLIQLISFENIKTLDGFITLKSLEIFKENKLDFVDCLLCAYAENDTIKTFDKKLLKCIGN
jgi:predicted nucleic-acid-binding protein